LNKFNASTKYSLNDPSAFLRAASFTAITYESLGETDSSDTAESACSYKYFFVIGAFVSPKPAIILR
jgi:hypothetical protein